MTVLLVYIFDNLGQAKLPYLVYGSNILFLSSI